MELSLELYYPFSSALYQLVLVRSASKYTHLSCKIVIVELLLLLYKGRFGEILYTAHRAQIPPPLLFIFDYLG